MEKFYTCKYDFVFEKIFMKEENQDLLIYLLEEILKTKIHSLAYLDLGLRPDYIKKKYFDLSLKTDQGDMIININPSSSKDERAMNTVILGDIYYNFYQSIDNYYDNTKIIQINFVYDSEDDDLLRVYTMQDNQQKKYVDNLIFYELNMDKYKEFWYLNDKTEIEKNKGIIMLDLPPNELRYLSKDDVMVKKLLGELKKVNEDSDFIQDMITVDEK